VILYLSVSISLEWACMGLTLCIAWCVHRAVTAYSWLDSYSSILPFFYVMKNEIMQYLYSIFYFHTIHFCSMFINNQQMHWIFSSLWFYSAAATCFDMCVSSSGSYSVPAELHANRMQRLIRLYIIRCYVSVMWRPGVYRTVWLHCQACTAYTLGNVTRHQAST
jgi:hypothetical protein